MDLTKKKCVPCEGGDPPLTKEQVDELMPQVKGWTLNKDGWLIREFTFKDFAENMKFVNKVAEVAEQENHHPNIYVHSWNKLRLELYTHAINGLSENDFILAAKIDRLMST